MRPEQLKNSILQLAIQGKLVEQRKEEGTGEELYKVIQNEKKKLIKEGKIKKQKALPEISENEIPFEIPETWKWVRFGNVVNFSIGKTPPRAETQWWGNDTPWVSISDMTDYGFVESTKEKVSINAINKKFSKVVLKETLLMSFKLTVGRTSILKMDAVHNEAIISITPHIDYEYSFRNILFYILPIITQWGESKNAIKGKTLNTTSIKNLLVPLPPLVEQKRIVEKIEELLPLVKKYEKTWTRLEELNKKFPLDMKKSILEEVIKGKLVEQRKEDGTGEELYKEIQEEKQKLIEEGKLKKQKVLPEISEDEIPFDIPDNWKWVRIGDISNIINGDRGKNYPSKDKLTGEGIPFISAINLDGTTVIEDEKLLCLTDEQYDKLGSGKLVQGDLVLCIRGSIGKHGRYPFEKGAIASSLVILRSYLLNEYFIEYLMVYLDSFLFFLEIKKYDNGTAQPNLSATNLGKFLLPLPPLAEQKRIVEKIEELLPLCEKLK